jgi:hypothetical protein
MTWFVRKNGVFNRKNAVFIRKTSLFIRKMILFIRKLEKSKDYFQFKNPEFYFLSNKKVPINNRDFLFTKLFT